MDQDDSPYSHCLNGQEVGYRREGQTCWIGSSTGSDGQ